MIKEKQGVMGTHVSEEGSRRDNILSLKLHHYRQLLSVLTRRLEGDTRPESHQGLSVVTLLSIIS